MALSTEELLLLENLMYLDSFQTRVENSGGGVETVSDLIATLDPNHLPSGSYMTQEDWSKLVTAIQNNDVLMDMHIAQVHVDGSEGGGGGFSAVFVSENTGEAVVAFRGTAGGEWKDNFTGGGPTNAGDGVSTAQQENALAWYRDAYEQCGLEDYEVTVTGHSKGGNKAKYITLLDSSVDRCVSFDGQGFSDEFIDRYQDEIAQRQMVIENHNVDNDYVNLLLNDVGETTYYQGHDYGEGGFLEAHCPNTFFEFDENGNPVMTVAPGGQDETMRQLDDFLNSMMRAMPPEQKVQTLEFIGQMVEGGFGGEDMQFFVDLLFDGDNLENTAFVLAYLIEYEQANPEFAPMIQNFLQEFGLEDLAKWVGIADGIMNWKYFDTAVSALDFVGGIIPGWVLDYLSDYIYENWGIRMSSEELKRLLCTLGMVSENMDRIQVRPNSGQDKQVASIAGLICVKLYALRQGETDMANYAKTLADAASRVQNIRFPTLYMNGKYHSALRLAAARLEQAEAKCASMAEALGQIEELYRTTEQRLTVH